MPFITFEGPDGSGKSTQIQLLHDYLRERGIPAIVTRQPRGTEVGRHIAHVILELHDLNISPTTELFLYAADRSQHVEEVIRPALAAGSWVLCDRYVDSSLALQGAGGVVLDLIEEVNRLATLGLLPDLTLLLDLSPEQTMQRIMVRDRRPDRMEQKGIAFHQRVRAIYLELASKNGRWIRVDGAQPIEEVQRDIRALIDPYIAKWHPFRR